MAARVVDVIERNLSCVPFAPVALTQNASTEIIPDSTADVLPDELVYLQLFNTAASGGASVYINLGAKADNIRNFVVIIAPQQQYSVPVRQSVNGFTTGAGVTVAVTKIVRQEFGNRPNIL